jgi:N-acetylglucosaminyl-diphospho-decaprenol L-rhamnosyltransferase
MDFSITVVSHNQRELIEKYLPSILDVPTSATFEVALIDNALTDGSSDWVSTNLPQVGIIRNNVPKSYAENMNQGMRALMNGRYFVVCNPDIKILPGLWDEAIKFMDNNPDVGIMGPQLLNPDNTIQPSCRRFSTPLTLLTRGLHLDSLLSEFGSVHKYLMLDYDHKAVKDVDWVTGALMIVRREAIAHIGGMDERYKMAYSEDQDWCCRMWRGGWRVCYVPQARAIHDHQQSGMRRPWSKMGRVQLINNIRLFKKFGWKLSRS